MWPNLQYPTRVNLEKYFCPIGEYEQDSDAKKTCTFNKRYYDEMYLHKNRKVFELFDDLIIDENDGLKIHVMFHCTPPSPPMSS